ncbi:MAG: TIGR03768 family metallophosphoesterase [Methylococcaceae bacterium]|nr:TIGR03768 family metallophosphoesterase [Methylococcaceae bacterium]
MKNDNSQITLDLEDVNGISRRKFLKYSTGMLAAVALYPQLGFGYGRKIQAYPIAFDYSAYPISGVATTAQRMLSFKMNWSSPADSALLSQASKNLYQHTQSASYDGKWSFGAALPVQQRTDIMPLGYSNPTPTRQTKFVNFFAITDIHITDKESPNQLIYLQQQDAIYSGKNSSIYSPVMMYTTHVLDAAIQTVNALHQQNSFDFGISLGDTCNNTQYNELRWYIDVFDGKVIIPSSGAHVGADSIDYQMPYQAAGLDKTIPWYQVLGNHDHFFIGSFPVDADPTLGIRDSYIADAIWSVGDILVPNFTTFPALFSMENIKVSSDPLASRPYYMGNIDGASPYGNIINMGTVTDLVFAAGAPKVVADQNRRSLLRAEWVQEFYNTTTQPVGHGFNLVDKNNPESANGFACYSFVPKEGIPLKVIVLDNTQSENDGSADIHGHGYLDANRWAWLQAELAAGQADNQLMIIAAHIPIAVAAIGSELEWWLGDNTTTAEYENAVTIDGLVQTLWEHPNVIAWIAGHRHTNTVKAFISPDPSKSEQGFWQIESSSLRDFPQQFRTFELYLNSDYTVSIVTINVDPAIKEGTPAAKSRESAIATQQILKTNLTPNVPNSANFTLPYSGSFPVPSMDPSRPQNGTTDETIQWVNLSTSKNGVPYNASYNAELFKQLSPQMVKAMKEKYPHST